MKMIQIRNVPDELHRKLKARAAEQGLSLSDYLLRMAEREASALTLEEWTERARLLPKARRGGPTAVELLREARGSLGR